MASDSCTEDPQSVLSTLLVAERISMTLYYTALTSRAVISHPYLAGATGDPNHVARNGNGVNVANLQAALYQEQQHAALLQAHGASSAHRRFFFPAPAFTVLGYTSQPGSFLWVMDHLETYAVGACLAAVRRFGALGDAGIAQLMARLAASESQHRVIGRVIAGESPANNVALEVTSYVCVSELLTALRPYLTGSGFPAGASPAIPLPSPAQIAAVVGPHQSR